MEAPGVGLELAPVLVVPPTLPGMPGTGVWAGGPHPFHFCAGGEGGHVPRHLDLPPGEHRLRREGRAGQAAADAAVAERREAGGAGDGDGHLPTEALPREHCIRRITCTRYGGWLEGGHQDSFFGGGADFRSSLEYSRQFLEIWGTPACDTVDPRRGGI